MTTSFQKPAEDCSIRLDAEHQKLYKYCRRPQLYNLYSAAFQREYTAMKALENTQSKYAACFPVYQSCGFFKDGEPYICMDYIKGPTLEEKLTEKQNVVRKPPTFLFTCSQLSHICSQVCEALSLLCMHDMLYFDLLPRNIIVENQNFDIRLVDLTFCYQLSLPDSQRYKKLDHRLHTGLPLPQRTEYALSLFLTRLFYCGEQQYNEYFHPHAPQGASADSSRTFFRRHFHELLHLLFDAGSEKPEASLSDDREACRRQIESWCSRLQYQLCRISSNK